MHGVGIFDAVATVRDAIAYPEKTQTPLYVLSLARGLCRLPTQIAVEELSGEEEVGNCRQLIFTGPCIFLIVE